MEKFDRKIHWENIYQTKDMKDVSWYQSTPETSQEFFNQLNTFTNKSQQLEKELFQNISCLNTGLTGRPCIAVPMPKFSQFPEICSKEKFVYP